MDRCVEPHAMWTRARVTVSVLVALGAAGTAGPAWADDSAPLPSLATTVDAALDAAAAAASGPEATQTDTLATVAAGTAADTTPVASDITATNADTAPEAGVAVPALTVQVSPGNVNVSIRVDSPGDDGAVTQVNVAGAVSASDAPVGEPDTAVSALTPETVPRDVSQGTTQSGGRSAGATSPSQSTAGSTVDTGTGQWVWNWDCASAPAMPSVPAIGMDGETTPWNWTWNWNCGTNTSDQSTSAAQYQDAITKQYQPTNVNISVRVSSPGNNGSVTQANVAVGVSVAADVGARPSAASAAVAVQVGSSSSPRDEVSTTAPASSASEEANAVMNLVALIRDALVYEIGDELSWLGLGLTAEGEAEVVHGVSLNGLAAELGPGGKARIRRALVERWVARCCTIQPVPPIAGGGEPIRREAPRIQSVRRSNASRTPLPFPRLPERPIAGTSVAQASAGGSSSGFPFFVLLPFAFAALDLTRRVALPRAIWPSGRNDVPFDPPG